METLESITSKDDMMPPFKDIYQGKSVLITGHTGFKGSWLSVWLKALGSEVIGYSLEPSTSPSNFIACGLSDDITHIVGDIRDLPHLLQVFKTYRPDVVFHLAAQSLVRLSYQQPKETFDINVGGTVNVIEAVRQSDSVQAAIIVTSDKCYENHEWVWGYREDDPLGGYDPYSASKGCAELVCASYLRSFFLSNFLYNRSIGLATARSGNVIGGGDWAMDRIIPDSVRALTAGEKIMVRNPKAVRPWQHVLEPLGGYLWLGVKLIEGHTNYNGAWNFGPQNNIEYTVQNMVEHLIKVWGTGAWVEASKNRLESLHEAFVLKLCCDKANIMLSWKAILDLQTAIEMTAQWYREYYNNKTQDEMYHITKRQIEEYTLKAAESGMQWAT